MTEPCDEKVDQPEHVSPSVSIPLHTSYTLIALQRVPAAAVALRIPLAENRAERLRQRLAIIPHQPVVALPTIQPHALDAPRRDCVFVHQRRAFAFEMDQVRHVARHLGCRHAPRFILCGKCHAAALFASTHDRGEEIAGGQAVGFAVEAAVQEEDLEPRSGDGVAHASEDEAGDDGGVEAADAVDDGFGGTDGSDGARVRGRSHLVAVGADVPQSLDSAGQRGTGVVGLGESDGGLAEGGERGRRVGVLLPVFWLGWWRGGGEGCWLAWVADGVLPGYDATVSQTRGNVMGEIAAYGRHDGGPAFVYTAHDCKEVDGGFEASGEQAGAGEEEVADGGRLEVEDIGGRSSTFQDLEIEVGEDGADEESLRSWDGGVEGRCAGQEGLELAGGGGRGGGEAVIEEGANRKMGWGDQSDQPAWGTWLVVTILRILDTWIRFGIISTRTSSDRRRYTQNRIITNDIDNPTLKRPRSETA